MLGTTQPASPDPNQELGMPMEVRRCSMSPVVQPTLWVPMPWVMGETRARFLRQPQAPFYTLQVCFLPKVAMTPAQPTFNDRRNCPGEPLGWLHHKPLTCNSPSTFLAIRLYQMSYMGAPHHATEQHRAAPAGMSLGSSSSGCCPATLDAGWEKRGCSSPMLPTFPRRRMSPCLCDYAKNSLSPLPCDHQHFSILKRPCGNKNLLNNVNLKNH